MSDPILHHPKNSKDGEAILHHPKTPDDVEAILATLRETYDQTTPPTPNETLDVLESWGRAIAQSPLMQTPGMVFLTLWLRRGTLEPILQRQLGDAALTGDWQAHGPTCTRPVPLGLVGHFPAGNVPIQPLLTATCGLLGGNVNLVRVPTGLDDLISQALPLLRDADPHQRVSSRLAFVKIPSARRDLLSPLAAACDGAMIWGGEQAVLAVRSLPFPHWTRLATFGPRISVAVIDAKAWREEKAREAWALRLARDVWQFEQRACSSPQILYVQRDANQSADVLLDAIRLAFERENAAHPRDELSPHAAAAITRARAGWLLDEAKGRTAFFPATPDWTILVGEGLVTDDPVQNKCLVVSLVDDLCEPIRHFDGNVQTLGIACGDVTIELELVAQAARRGVDRIAQVGRMHVFDSPWDGQELIAPMTRRVRYTPTETP